MKLDHAEGSRGAPIRRESHRDHRQPDVARNDDRLERRRNLAKKPTKRECRPIENMSMEHHAGELKAALGVLKSSRLSDSESGLASSRIMPKEPADMEYVGHHVNMLEEL